jgi:hypothetical protein
VKFEKGKLDSNSKSLTSDAEAVNQFAGRTGGISLSWPGYGLTGRDCDNAHEQARTQQVEALKIAKQVLESWREALSVADSKYVEADDQGFPDPRGGGNGLPVGGPGGLGGLNGPGPGGGLPDPRLADPGLPDPRLDANLPDPRLKDPNLPNPNLPNPNLPDPNLPDPNGTNPDITNPNLTDPNLANPNVPNPNLTNPNLTNPNLTAPDVKQPDLSGLDPTKNGVPDPTRTGLSGFDPSNVQTPQVRAPEGLPTADPGRVTTGTPAGGGAGIGGGSGMGGAGPLAGGRMPGGAAGAAGMGGMPFMPMTPMGAGDKEREGKGSELLRGDHGDWDDDEGVTDAVLRHEGA